MLIASRNPRCNISASNKPRIAYFDIENAPILGYSWSIWETNVIEVIQPSYLLCFSYKWVGEKKVHTRALPDYSNFRKNKTDDSALCRDLHKFMCEADIIIAQNGDAFDIKKSNARLAANGIEPPSPYKTIDTLKIARRHFKFDSNKLDALGGYLQAGRKLATTGKQLWFSCMAGDKAAWRKMIRYNVQDVNLLEQVYLKLRPWAANHPNLNTYTEGDACPKCQSKHTIHRGFNRSKVKAMHKVQCLDCRGYFSTPIKQAA